MVVAGEGVAVAVKSGAARPLLAAQALEVPLPRQENLGHGELRHRHGVGRPGAEHLHPGLQVLPGKALHRAGGVKHRLKAGEIRPNLLLPQGGHAPGGKEVGHLPQLLFPGGQLLLQQDPRQEIQGGGKPLPGGGVVGEGKLVLLAHIDKRGALFHKRLLLLLGKTAGPGAQRPRVPAEGFLAVLLDELQQQAALLLGGGQVG